MTPLRKFAVVGVLSLALTAPLTACTAGDETTPVGQPDAAASSATASADSDAKDDSDTGAKNSDSRESAEKDTGADAVTADAATTDVLPLDAPAVAVAAPGDGAGLTVELAEIVRTESEPSMPGEIAGSAIQVDVTVGNTGTARHDLSASVVNLYYGPDQMPASMLSGSGQENLPAWIPAGEKATGTYVFAVPEDINKRIQVEIDVDPELQVVLFEGEVSR